MAVGYVFLPKPSRRGYVRMLAMHLLALRAGIFERTKLLVGQQSGAEATEHTLLGFLRFLLFQQPWLL